MRRGLRSLISALLLGALAMACTIEAGDLEQAEEQYLEEINDALRPLRESTKAFDQSYRETGSRARFVEDLKRIPAHSRIVRAFRAVRGIKPPTRFFRDQRRLLETFVGMAPIARDAEQLVAGDDVVKASVRFAEAGVLFERALRKYSSRFCLVTATSAAERQLCDPIGILPGAAYGDRLQAVLAKASAEFTPRGFTYVAQAFTNTDVALYLRSMGPPLVKGVRRARDDVAELVPPDEFAADHRILEEYFDDLVDVSERIEAAAQANPGRLLSLFPESQRIVQRASRELSEDIRPAVAVWFFPAKDEG